MKKAFLDEITQPKKKKKRSISPKKLDFLDPVELVKGEKSNIGESLFLVLLVFAVFLFFIAKSFELQIIKGKENAILADANRTKTYSVPAERGVIYDRNGEVLVRNQPSFSLVMDARSCFGSKVSYQACIDDVNSISQIISIEKDRIIKDLSENKPNIVIADNMTKDEVLILEPSLSSYNNLEVMTYPLREYLYKEAFAHVIGYVGSGDTLYPSIEGKMGLEEYYDEYLSGVSGKRIVQTDALGNKVSDVSLQEAVPGRDVVLNIDLGLQLLSYTLIKEKVEAGEALGGVVVAQDPKTGGILAMVSYPSFDPQGLVSGISSKDFEQMQNDPGFPFFNRAVSAVYPPGSVFKMIPASAALSEGVVTEHTLVFDPGYIQIGSYIFRNWKLDGHGDVNLKRALQVSNDTYFYTIGGGYGNIKGLGIEKLSEWARKFGLSQKTGIDINGEVPGYFPDGTQRQWYLGDTYITTIGQGDTLATPLQMNNMVSYFANGGFLMRPRIAKEVDDHLLDNEVISQGLISDYVYETVRDGMRMAVKPGGTGYPFFDFDIEVAGKTGTSEYTRSDGKDSTHAWFSVFGPYDDAAISLTVFLEDGFSGADDAAPIARELMEYYLKGSKPSI